MPNLIGTGNNQVPTNGMLGGLAYQSPDNAVIKNLELTNLSGHNSLIPSTAVDVFVYDTRKDSDGGAWRKRTQHTSWYNETLNTATRGSRRDFPAVAVIVAQSDKITIYDADDPDIPMWMVFNTTDGSMLRSGIITSINVLNAELWVAHGSGSGIHWINFLKDTARWITGSTSYGGFFIKRDISRRNEAGANYYNNIGGASDIIIADSSINDVAMTVLPNAPIDSATGLPVPTIAVATDGGVSVIKDDGDVISTTGSGYFVKKINFTDDYGLNVIISNSSNENWINAYVNDYTTINGLSYITYNNFDGVVYRTKYDPKALTYNTASPNDTISNFIDLRNRSSAIGGAAIGGGLTLLEKSPKNAFDPDAGMVAFATTSYNTGWMHGDIKGAFLSDTDATNVTGTELVTNGDGTTTTGWTAGSNNTLIVTGGNFKCTTNQNDGAFFGQGISVVSGKTYVFKADIISDGTSKSVRMYLGPTVGNGGYAINQEGNVLGGIATIYWTATFTGTAYLWFYGQTFTSGTYILVDNVSARLAELDRSVKNKGLQVFGTVTKSPVVGSGATAAELVAYSGFNDSNYLEQPYNSDLDFGTGDFSVTVWIKPGATGDQQSIVNFLSTDSGGNAEDGFYLVHYNNATGNWYFGTFQDGSVEYTSLSLGSITNTDKWYCLHVNKIGTTAYLYQDGVSIGSGTVKSDLTINSADQSRTYLRIGKGNINGIFLGGSLSLVRISDSVPSPEQIKKIYEDEKVLFQENAACTLYGSSDAVTALAYDDSTNLLYAGTSSGRSDFQGLRRINNTTTAVTTAISASNGLIAEQ